MNGCYVTGDTVTLQNPAYRPTGIFPSTLYLVKNCFAFHLNKGVSSFNPDQTLCQRLPLERTTAAYQELRLFYVPQYIWPFISRHHVW